MKFILFLALCLSMMPSLAAAQETSADFSDGSIKFSNAATGTCNSTYEGALRYTTANGFELCNGTDWFNLETGATIGAGAGLLNLSGDFSEGSVFIGNDANPCGGPNEGALRYNGSVPQFCDGAAWSGF